MTTAAKTRVTGAIEQCSITNEALKAFPGLTTEDWLETYGRTCIIVRENWSHEPVTLAQVQITHIAALEGSSDKLKYRAIFITEDGDRDIEGQLWLNKLLPESGATGFVSG